MISAVRGAERAVPGVDILSGIEASNEGSHCARIHLHSNL